MPDRYNAVFLFGAPGTGKGTQGKLLGAIPGFYHFSSGDMFRNLDKNCLLSKTFLSYSTKGLLVPDELTIQLWADYIHRKIASQEYKPDQQLLLLDGIPRTIEQLHLMTPHLNTLQTIHLICQNEEEMVQRMKHRALEQNRPDDADEKVIRKRFEVYHAQTQPMLKTLPPNKITNVNAVGSPARILADILKALVPLQEKNCTPWAG